MIRLGAAPAKLTVEAALRDIGSRDARVRTAAADALGGVPPAARDQAATALIGALSDRDHEVRATAALALAELGLERAVTPLLVLLDDPAAPVRQAGAVALGRLGLGSAFEPLAVALRTGADDVRFQAATSLVEIDSARALQPLLGALDDGDGEVLGAVALGLAAIGEPAAVEPLAARLDHPRKETRFDIAYALARLGDPRGRAILVDHLGDEAHGWDAVEGLEMIGGPEVADPLAAAMVNDRLPRQVSLRAAAAMLAMAPASSQAERARAVLIRGLSALRYRHRSLAVELLGQVGGAWAREPLATMARRLGGRALVGEIEDALRRIDERAPEPA